MRWTAAMLVGIISIGCGPSRDARVANLTARFEKAASDASEAYAAAKTKEERERLAHAFPDTAAYAQEFLALAEEAPGDEAAFRAAAWIVEYAGDRTESDRALELIAQQHLTHDELRPIVAQLDTVPGPRVESLLRAVADQHPDRATRGVALLILAENLQHVRERKELLQSDIYPDARDRLQAFLGVNRLKYVEERDVSAAEVEALLQEVIDRFGDVPSRRKNATLGDLAKGDLFEIQRLAIGMEAPDIEGEAVDGSMLKLSDFRGKIVLLEFWGDW